MASSDGTVPFVRDLGSGPVVLLAHSAGGTSGQWRGLTDRLVSRFRVLAPDLYGHGRTPPWPGDPDQPDRPFALDDETRALAGVLEASDEPAHVIGHSYGAAACVQLALRHPERVRSLVVFEPTLFRILRGTDREADWEEVSSAATGMVELAEAGQPRAGARRFFDYLMGEGAWDALPSERRDVLAAMMPVTITRECRTQMFDDAIRRVDYAALSMPVTVVVGTRSPPAMAAVGEVLVATAGSARLVRLPGADHMGPLTSPEAFGEIVEDALG